MKTYIISTTSWEKIATKNFWDITVIVSDDTLLSNLPVDDFDKNSKLTAWIPLTINNRDLLRVKWPIGAVVTIFANTIAVWWWWGWGWSPASCTFDWVYQTPSGHVTGTTCQEWIDLHFPSQPPTISIRWTVAFWLYEVWQILTTPLIEVRWALWSNPAGVLTNLSITDPVFSQANPTPWTRYWTNDWDITIIEWLTKTYHWHLDDDQWRSANASWSYSWAYPYYGTSVNITTLTKQTLTPNTNTYFPVDMVAETGWDKYKADFENANVSITWIQFYNTISWAWEWMWGSKANSLTLRDTTAVTHTVQGNVVNYTRYTHNWPDGGALQTRFYTN